MTERKNASKTLIRMHLIFSGISFLIFSLFLLLASKEIAIDYFQGKILAITHIATLCWFTPFLFALLYQYSPKIFFRKLYSITLAKISFWFLVVGSLMLVYAFWINRYDKLLTIPSHILLFPFLFLLINVIVTSIKSPKRNIEQWYFIASVVWLFITVIVGFLLAMNFTKPLISASHLEWLMLHANIGFVGWFLLFIVGLSIKSVEKEHIKNADKRLLRLCFFLINFGLVLYFFEKGHNQSRLIDIPTAILILGIIGVIGNMAKTALVHNAESLKRILFPFFVLMVPVVLAFYLVFTSSLESGLITKASIIYGMSLLLGFVALWTFSHLKALYTFINPMYDFGNNSEVDIKVKSFANMLSLFHLSSYLVAVIALLIGILMEEAVINQIASVLLIFSSVMFNVMLFKVLFSKVKN